MRSRSLALAAIASITLATSPMAAPPAQAQTASEAVAYVLPIALWAITGTVLGAVAWPIVAGGAAAGAPITSAGALINPGAALGTVLGGVGYVMVRQ